MIVESLNILISVFNTVFVLLSYIILSLYLFFGQIYFTISLDSKL